jgi:acyl-CoA reductase-like NAD-dependent aldehyde dehydrogenase
MSTVLAKPSSRVDPAATYREAQRLADKVLVGGLLQAAIAEATLDVVNPATMEVISRAPSCGAPDIARAVASAQAAFPAWSRLPARERGRRLAQGADLIAAHAEELARLQTLETGHALATLSRGDVGAAIDMLRMFAGLAGEIKGRTVPDLPGMLHYTTCEPLGVVGAIIPWNGPVFTLSAKIGPAIIAGNTIVIKTAEEAPLAVLRACELLQAALPPGVVNVVSGIGEEAGRELALHPAVRKVTFTGSVPVGQQIMHYAASKLCPVTLELGGSNPNIVAADADLALAVPGIVLGMRFARQSQSCIAGSRIFVHADVYDQVVAQVVTAVSLLVVGDPFDERTQIGALSSQRQYDRLQAALERVRATPGARVLRGGGRPSDPALKKGLFLEPTLVDGITNSSSLCQEEIFGPVGFFIKWTDHEEVIAAANDTPYGLIATLWTRDLARALDFVSRIQAGLVQVNNYNGPRPNVAYGGTKMSGLGKEYSLESMIQHFTFSKTVLLNAGQIR